MPANNYMSKVNNRNTRTRCEIFSELSMKTPETCQQHHSVVFIVNFEHISQLDLMLLLSTLCWYMPVNLYIKLICVRACDHANSKYSKLNLNFSELKKDKKHFREKIALNMFAEFSGFQHLIIETRQIKFIAVNIFHKNFEVI